MSFEKNVFINCPFDKEFKPLLKALIFTILYLELEPRIATTFSSGNIRVVEIMRLIRNSKYSIHDISRCEPLTPGELPRFNMPYELGLDIGCREFGYGLMKSKLCLILEKEKHRYNAVISDISGQDIKDHNNNHEQLIVSVREWFCTVLNITVAPASLILTAYNDCQVRVNASLIANGFTKGEVDDLSTTEFIKAFKLELAH